MKIARATSKTGVTFTRQPDGSFQKAAEAGRAIKSFDVSSFNRLTNDWQVTRLSADGELQGKLEIMRSRSRDHEQNDPYAENYLKLRENNVIGHDGFTLQMKVKLSEEEDGATGEMVTVLDKVANRAIERAWKRFCQRKNFLVTRDMHAVEACKLIERTYNRDGDLLIRKVRGAPNEFGFALQLLEADYLDDRYIDFRGVPCNCPNERTLPDGRPFPYCERGLHEVRMGVELHGDWKFPVAYWLLANHPGDYFFGNQYATRRMRIPVEDIIHPFARKRIEQTRGIPATVAAMMRLQMIGGMDEAALVAARAGAQKMGVITKTIPDDFEVDADYEKEGLGRTIDGAPGEFLELPMGFDVKSIDWKNPDNSYPPFQKTQLRGAAAGMGVSYSSLANDPSDANFSATRIGMLEEREGYRGGQRFFINQILLEAFPGFLEGAMLNGLVDLPWARFEEFTDHEAVCFHGRGFPWIDPTKDIQAAKEAIELGVDTRSRIAGENAGDFEEITAELGREKELRKAAGLEESLDPTPLSGTSVSDTIGGKVGTLQAMMGVVKQVPAEKACEALQVIFGLDPEAAQRVVDLLAGKHGEAIVAEVKDAAAEEAETAKTAAAKPTKPAAEEKPAEEKKPEAVKALALPAEGAVKSACLGDVNFAELPEEVRTTIAQFQTVPEGGKVTRYQMTVPELLTKVDQHNYATAQKRTRRLTVGEAGDIVRGRPDKAILLLNDRIIDGHHHLAKAEKGKVTSSLAVIDVTPLRFQAA